MKLNANYWDERYQQKQTAWDIGEVSPALRSFIDNLKDKNLRILIPGCGNAHEAEYLLNKGFTQITLLDISPTLSKKLQEQWTGNPAIQVICEDFFKHEARYDLIIEQTFFCALHPELREKYVEKINELLEPGGRLLGVLFNCQFPNEGPPFGGNEAEYKVLFENVFSKVNIQICTNSIEPRKGNEVCIDIVK